MSIEQYGNSDALLTGLSYTIANANPPIKNAAKMLNTIIGHYGQSETIPVDIIRNIIGASYSIEGLDESFMAIVALKELSVYLLNEIVTIIGDEKVLIANRFAIVEAVINNHFVVVINDRRLKRKISRLQISTLFSDEEKEQIRELFVWVK